MHRQPKFKLSLRLMALALSICVAGPIYAGPGFAHELNRETAVVKAVRAVSPAVVNISSAYEVRKRTGPFSGFGMNPFFEEFFSDFFDPRFNRRQKQTSLGSGVIIDGKKGLILTNAHVIQKTGTPDSPTGLLDGIHDILHLPRKSSGPIYQDLFRHFSFSRIFRYP